METLKVSFPCSQCLFICTTTAPKSLDPRWTTDFRNRTAGGLFTGQEKSLSTLTKADLSPDHYSSLRTESQTQILKQIPQGLGELAFVNKMRGYVFIIGFSPGLWKVLFVAQWKNIRKNTIVF